MGTEMISCVMQSISWELPLLLCRKPLHKRPHPRLFRTSSSTSLNKLKLPLPARSSIAASYLPLISVNSCNCFGQCHRLQRVIVRGSPNPRFPFGDGDEDEDAGIVEKGPLIVNLAMTAGFAYLAVTGNLGWLFDTLFTFSLLLVLIPLFGLVAFFWIAAQEILQGNCPNCGNQIQVLESVMKEGPQLCPYCNKPFRSGSKEFAWNPFKGIEKLYRKPSAKDPSEMIVDVEAEVTDKD